MSLQPDWAVAGLHLAIIATVIYAAKFVFEFRNRLAWKGGQISLAAFFVALATVGIFHLLDLLSPYFFPPLDSAPGVETKLHLQSVG